MASISSITVPAKVSAHLCRQVTVDRDIYLCEIREDSSGLQAGVVVGAAAATPWRSVPAR